MPKLLLAQLPTLPASGWAYLGSFQEEHVVAEYAVPHERLSDDGPWIEPPVAIGHEDDGRFKLSDAITTRRLN